VRTLQGSHFTVETECLVAGEEAAAAASEHSRPGFRHQDLAYSMVSRALVSRAVSHAYLYHGPEGLGKSEGALWFAAGLLCPQGEGIPCEICPVCSRVTAHAHPDVHEIGTPGTRIGIEEIRALRKAVGLRPFEGAVKVVIVHQAHLMTSQAANALLKSLEEPPEDAVFILTADSPQSLLPTVLSRCQPIPFRPFPLRVLEPYLFHLGVCPEDLAHAYALSGGNPAVAEVLFGSEDYRLRLEMIEYLLDQLQDGSVDPLSAHQWVVRLASSRDEAVRVLDLLALTFRKRVMNGAAEEQGPPRELFSTYSYWVEQIEETKTVLRKNANLTLALEVLLDKLRRASR